MELRAQRIVAGFHLENSYNALVGRFGNQDFLINANTGEGTRSTIIGVNTYHEAIDIKEMRVIISGRGKFTEATLSTSDIYYWLMHGYKVIVLSITCNVE